MRRAAFLAVLALPTMAATDPHAQLQEVLRGKAPGADRRCISPDPGTPFKIVNGTTIIYWRAGETYVSHFKGGCRQLRDDRTVVTVGNAGELCANDPARVVGGGAGFGFCTFSGFTPYTKTK